MDYWIYNRQATSIKITASENVFKIFSRYSEILQKKMPSPQVHQRDFVT